MFSCQGDSIEGMSVGSTFLHSWLQRSSMSGLAPTHPNPALKSALIFRNRTVSPVSPLLRRWKSFSTVGSSMSFEKITMEEPPLSPRNNLKAAACCSLLQPSLSNFKALFKAWHVRSVPQEKSGFGHSARNISEIFLPSTSLRT